MRRSMGPLVGLVLALAIAPAGAQVVRQLTDEKTTLAGPGALDDAGTTLFTGSTDDPLGSNRPHATQIFRFPATGGTPVQLTSAARGVAAFVSASDDGQWLAFASPGDLTGENHDQSPELFLMRSDGTGLRQLTSETAVNGGSVTAAVISGDGARVAFVANTDPLGENPDGLPQLFLIGSDGTGLRQLTHATAGSFGAIGIDDAGARIAFAHDGDLVGLNPDGGSEIFTINADGTGLSQLTLTAAGYESSAPSLAGSGNRIAFQSNGDLTGANPLHQTEIFVVDWSGSGLTQLTATQSLLGLTGEPQSAAPSITDDGQTVFFHSNHNTFSINVDGNFEIFRIGADGTGLSALTDSLLSLGNLLPVAAGAGGRVAYFALGDSAGLETIDGAGGNRQRLVTFEIIVNAEPDITPDGGRIVFARSTGLLNAGQIYRVEADGSGLAPVTSFTSGSVASPSIAGDRSTIVFAATADPFGTNQDGSREIFAIQADGTGLRQLTDGPAGTSSERPRIARDGSTVVFDSDADLTGANPQGARQVFRVDPAGGALLQLTAGAAGTTSRAPRPDASGTLIVFESNADLAGTNPDGGFEVFLVHGDGSGTEQLTSVAAGSAGSPDLSDDGSLIVYASDGDPLASNPERNAEVFLFDRAAGVTRQLTQTAEGNSSEPRISGDGRFVYFRSDAPFTESDPDRPVDLYRVPAAGGTVRRVGALRAGLPGAAEPDASGDRAAWSGTGDFTMRNADLLPEIWLIDRLTPPRFEITPETPTVLRWTPLSGPLRYDAIRGDVAALGPGGLGPAVCLEDDSPDADTDGFGDAVAPAAGQAFFYLYRGSEGLFRGPGDYGADSDGVPRPPPPGDCPP